MLWGEPWGGFWGDPDELVMSLDIADLGDGPRVRVKINPDVRTGTRLIADGLWGEFMWGDDWGATSESYDQTYSQFVRLIVDGKFQGPYVWAKVGKTVELLGTWGKGSGDHVVSVQLNGDSNDPNNAYPNQSDAFLETRADRLKVDVTAVPTLESAGDGGQLSSWVLSGMKRFTNVRPVDLFPNWGRLEITLVDTAGTRAVTLSQNGREVASGSLAGDGTITLTESNGSGLSGSVDVAYTGDVTSGSDLTIRWPQEFAIHYKQSAFTAPDFPRTPEAVLVDDGRNNARTYRSTQLASGTWRIVAHQRDDNGNESTGLASGGDSVALVAPPDPPTALAYASGGAAATIIQWTASATGGATYNIYDSGAADVINLDTATATHIAGVGTLQQTLPAISTSYTGTRRVIVRAVDGGIVEGNAETLYIEYVNGQVVPARPPKPKAESYITLSGRTLTVPAAVNLLQSSGTPVWLHLFLRAPGAAFDYDNPDTVVALGTAVGQAIVTDLAGVALEASYTHGSDALLEYALRTATAIAGVVEVNGDANNQTSNWVFSGQSDSNTNGGFLYWKLTDVAGTRTVQVYSDAAMAVLVAAGTRVGDGGVSLAAFGGSGLDGSVDVAYTGDDTDAGNSLALNVSSDNVDYYGPVKLTTAAPADPVQSSEAGI